MTDDGSLAYPSSSLRGVLLRRDLPCAMEGRPLRCSRDARSKRTWSLPLVICQVLTPDDRTADAVEVRVSSWQTAAAERGLRDRCWFAVLPPLN